MVDEFTDGIVLSEEQALSIENDSNNLRNIILNESEELGIKATQDFIDKLGIYAHINLNSI